MASKTTSTTNIPPPTGTELRLQEKQLELAELQIDAINSLTEQQKEQFALTQPLFELSTGILTQQLKDLTSPEALAKAERIEALQTELLELNVENIKRGGAATPEQLEFIRTQTELGIEAGVSDIDAATRRALTRVREELAPAAVKLTKARRPHSIAATRDPRKISSLIGQT